VDAAGDDAASGTAAAPWRTLAFAVGRAPAGATIRLGAGEFAATTISSPGIRLVGTGAETVISGGLIVRADGVSVSNVTLTGQTRAHRGGVVVEGARDVAIRNSVIRGNPFGIHLLDAPGARIEGNLVTDNGYGIEVHGATDGTLVSGNDIVDNDRRLDDSRGAGGVNLYFTTGGITLRANRIEGNDEVAIEIYAASDVTIEGNRLSGSNDLVETGTEDDRACDRLAITGNVLFAATPADAGEERGIYLRCASDARIAWNTFANLDRFAIGLFSGSGGFNGPLRDVTIEHNVIAGGRAFSIDSALPDSVSIDRDVIHPCSNGPCPELGRQVAFVAGRRAGTERWGQFRAWTGFESRGVFADPLFVDAASGDFSLRPGSPAAGFAGAFAGP
jgi:parallel beta-helix repeat protein